MAWYDRAPTYPSGPTDEPLDSPLGEHAHYNRGADWPVAEGTPIEAPVAGTIEFVGDAGNEGLTVAIRDGQGNLHRLGHMQAALTKEGASVARGAVIGYAGSTGASTGPHISWTPYDAEGNLLPTEQFSSAEGTANPITTPGSGTIAQRFQQAADQFWGVIDTARKAMLEDGVLDEVDATELAKLQKTWMELQQASLGQVKDIYKLQTEYTNTLNTLGMAEFNVFKGLSDIENARRISEYAAKVQEVQTSIAAGNLTLAQGRDQLNRWLSGRQEGRSRAEFIEKTLAAAAPWATSGGKTSFTSAELGAGNAALARLAGNDPNTTGIRFPGIRVVDPEAQLAAQDRAAGVEGPMPGVPVLPQINVPGAPTLAPFNRTPPTLQRPGSPPDISALMNEPPGAFASVPVQADVPLAGEPPVSYGPPSPSGGSEGFYRSASGEFVTTMNGIPVLPDMPFGQPYPSSVLPPVPAGTRPELWNTTNRPIPIRVGVTR